jgi:hypothetical protein
MAPGSWLEKYQANQYEARIVDAFTADEIYIAHELIEEQVLFKWVAYKSFKLRIRAVRTDYVAHARETGSSGYSMIKLFADYVYRPWLGFTKHLVPGTKEAVLYHRENFETRVSKNHSEYPPQIVLGKSYFGPKVKPEIEVCSEDDQVMLNFQAMMTARESDCSWV